MCIYIYIYKLCYDNIHNDVDQPRDRLQHRRPPPAPLADGRRDEADDAEEGHGPLYIYIYMYICIYIYIYIY